MNHFSHSRGFARHKKKKLSNCWANGLFFGSFFGDHLSKKNGTLGDADDPWIIDFYGERILGISHVEKFWMNLIELGYFFDLPIINS